MLIGTVKHSDLESEALIRVNRIYLQFVDSIQVQEMMSFGVFQNASSS